MFGDFLPAFRPIRKNAHRPPVGTLSVCQTPHVGLRYLLISLRVSSPDRRQAQTPSEPRTTLLRETVSVADSVGGWGQPPFQKSRFFFDFFYEIMSKCYEKLYCMDCYDLQIYEKNAVECRKWLLNSFCSGGACPHTPLAPLPSLRSVDERATLARHLAALLSTAVALFYTPLRACDMCLQYSQYL